MKKFTFHITWKCLHLDKDGPCVQKSGLCGPTYLPCKGTYHKGLCNGYPERQCCIPNQRIQVQKLTMSPPTPKGKLYNLNAQYESSDQLRI